MITIDEYPADSLAAHIIEDKGALKEKQVPALYIFENASEAGKNGRRAGAAFPHRQGKGLTLLIDGKRYAAFPPKPKTADQPAQRATTEGSGA